MQATLLNPPRFSAIISIYNCTNCWSASTPADEAVSFAEIGKRIGKHKGAGTGDRIRSGPWRAQWKTARWHGENQFSLLLLP
jgi:hypothetical protein